MERASKDPGQAGQPASLRVLGGEEPESVLEELAETPEFEDNTLDLEVHRAARSLQRVQRGVNRVAAVVMSRVVSRFPPSQGAATKLSRS